MLLDCTHIRQLNVYECQPLFYLDCHLPPTLNLQKNLLAFSLSLKGWSWSSLCLSCMSLFEFLFTLLMLLMCEFHLFIFSVAFLLLFQTCVLVTLQACVFDVFPNSCYFSKLTFWCSWSSHSCYFSWIDSCCFFQSCSCCSKLVTRFFVAPSSHFYYSFRSCSCCSKFMFLLLQARILVTFFRRVLIIPNLCSCCSKLVLKSLFSWLCYCCSKLVFECYSSQLCSFTPSSHFWYLKFNILRKNFHVPFGFFNFLLCVLAFSF